MNSRARCSDDLILSCRVVISAKGNHGMGVMQFTVHPSTQLTGPPPAQMTGFDGRIFPMRLDLEDGRLVCTRHHTDSGRLQILWPVAGIGPVVLSTASLRERTEPYLLALELARGTLSDLRNQAGTWDVAGLAFPDNFQPLYTEAQRLFRQAVLTQDHPAECSNAAWGAIDQTVRASRALTDAYVDQRLVFRQSRSHALPVSLGCDTGPVRFSSDDCEQFASVFNSALVPIEWRGVEANEGTYTWDEYDQIIDWCHDQRMFVVAGPLLDLAGAAMPAWLRTWQHDFLNLQSFVSDFVETAVSRYVGRVRHWEIVANANTGGALGLSEENRLSLAARTLEVARQVDDEIQLSLMIGQPFGEYMAAGQHRLSPMQFVDALARSGIGLSEAHLDIQLGHEGWCTLPRHTLQFSRLLDTWGGLGLPLSVSLSFARSLQDEAAQLDMLRRYVPLLMAKDAVVGIYWGCFRDGRNARRDGCGLVREDGATQDTFRVLESYRSRYWRTEPAPG